MSKTTRTRKAPATTRSKAKFGHGGARPGAGKSTLYGGKKRGGKIVGKRVSLVLTETGHRALLEQRDKLTDEEGRRVSLNDTAEWCIRTATERGRRR